MPRGGNRYVQTKPTRRDEIFQILVDFAKSHNGNSPTQLELWRQVQSVRKTKMAKGTFQDHLDKLVNEGRVCKIDGELVIPESEWTYEG